MWVYIFIKLNCQNRIYINQYWLHAHAQNTYTHMTTDPFHKTNNALDKYPTMHNFVTEMCTHVGSHRNSRASLIWKKWRRCFLETYFWTCIVSDRLHCSHHKVLLPWIQGYLYGARSSRICIYRKYISHLVLSSATTLPAYMVQLIVLKTKWRTFCMHIQTHFLQCFFFCI